MGNINYLRDKTALGVAALIAPQVRRDLIAQPPFTAPAGPMLPRTGQVESTFWQIAVPLSAGLSAYHGYKRNYDSLGWGVAWALLGGTFPIITPAIALAQGFGERGPR